MMAVHEMMSTAPVTVAPTTSIGDLLGLFDRYDFNAFPVLDERDRLCGIVSKLDVLQLAVHHASTPFAEGALSAACVADLMGPGIVFVEPHETIAAAGNLMVVSGLRSVPVVERRDDRSVLVGMLSRGDVLRALRFQLEDGEYVLQERAERGATDPPAWGVVSSRLDEEGGKACGHDEQRPDQGSGCSKASRKWVTSTAAR